MKKYYGSKLFCGAFCAAGAFLLGGIIAPSDRSVSIETFSRQTPGGIGYFLLIFSVLLFSVGFLISKLEKKKEI